MRNVLRAVPSSVVVNARNIVMSRTLEVPQSVILFDSHSTETDVYPLVTKSFPELHKRFNFGRFLFELRPSDTGLTVEKELAKDGKEIYDMLCENSNFPFEMFRFSNEKFGTKYDPIDFLKKDFMECGSRLTDRDVAQVVKKSFADSALTEDDKQDLAYSLWSVISNGKIADLARVVANTIGEEGCYCADFKFTGSAGSAENMKLRNVVMTDAIVTNLESPRGSIGLFGLGHYDAHGCGIKDMMTRIYMAQQSHEADLPDEERRLKRVTKIDPRQIVLIHAFKGKPLDAFGASYRRGVSRGEGDPFPLYSLDATAEDSKAFVEQISEIAETHRKKFPLEEEVSKGGSGR